MTQQRRGYAAYAQSKVETANPADLTLMLYDGAIKFANIAMMAMEEGDIEKCHNNIMKVRNIITEFQATLDKKYPVAEDFNIIYDYIKHCLTQANIHKDKAMMEEVLKQLRGMRDTWKEVMVRSRTGQAN